MKKLVEICCGSYQDALAAERGGAARIELNSGLFMGGLTPSLGSLTLVKQNTKLEVISMVRPRGAGFCYTEDEYKTMKLDAEILMKNGSDGIAFGILNSDATVDLKRSREIVKIIKKYQGQAVFHRAFDCVKDPFKAIEDLIAIDIDRVLTSGLRAKALEGIELLNILNERYKNQIEILPASGINPENAGLIIKKTGIYQVHSSCKAWIKDSTTSGGEVSYSYAQAPNKDNYDTVEEELVRDLLFSIKV